MPKKASVRKKGNLRSIPKQRIGRKRATVDQEDESNEKGDNNRFLWLSRSNLFVCSGKCFEIMFSICEKLHIIGFTRTSTGEFVLLDRRGQIWHRAAMAWYLAVCLQKTLGTVYVLLYEQLRVETFMCIVLVVVQTTIVLIGLGVLMRPKETVDLLNSRSYPPPMLDQLDSRAKLEPLDDISTCYKVICATLAAHGCAAVAVIITVCFNDLPICLFPMSKRFGLTTDGILSPFALRLLFAPLEWLMYLPPMSVTAFCGSILFMGTGALTINTDPSRVLRDDSMRSRQRLEQMYVRLELFHRIFQVWIRFFFPSWLLAYAGGTTMALLLTIRYTELPLVIYIFAPYAALLLGLIICWQSYDMIRVIKRSDDILGGMLQEEKSYLRSKTRKERVELMKRARAMRRLAFVVGDCEFSLSLPINTWEEILNQLVFLLSL